MEKYLEVTEIIDHDNQEIQVLAKKLANGYTDDTTIAKHCFEYVRDEIRHSGDHQDDTTTWRASDVLRHGTGWCYAKSHLLAALLRANGIPTGFCYQRLSCSEYTPDSYCLHGLNWIYLQEHGWYRVDARGNKKGLDAQFTPPKEQLAFALGENEYDLGENLTEPLDVIVETLQTYQSYNKIIHHFPDIGDSS